MECSRYEHVTYSLLLYVLTYLLKEERNEWTNWVVVVLYCAVLVVVLKPRARYGPGLIDTR